MPKEITTVKCQGPDNMLVKPAQATVEAGPTPRAVSCPFIVLIEATGPDGKPTKKVACKPSVEALNVRVTDRNKGASKLEITETLCIHAYPVRLEA